MKALVTGGAGFIGSNVVNLLLEEGHQVTVLDNLSSGYIENIQQVINEKRVEFIEADICDEAAVMEACRNKDIVFRLHHTGTRRRHGQKRQETGYMCAGPFLRSVPHLQAGVSPCRRGSWSGSHPSRSTGSAH